MGYDKGGFSALGRKGTDIRKKRMQYQKQQEAILAKKKLKKQFLKQNQKLNHH